MLKLIDNPPILSPEGAFEESLSQLWWVAHTKSRCEKAFAWDLQGQGIPCFLPMVQRITFSGGRKRHGMASLFPGYVFFSGDGEARYRALLTDHLCQVIEVHDQQRLISELRSIHQVLLQKVTLDLYPFAAIGRRCRVRSGPFQGIEGIVVGREAQKARFVLQVGILGQGAALEIDGDALESAADVQALAGLRTGFDRATCLTGQ